MPKTEPFIVNAPHKPCPRCGETRRRVRQKGTTYAVSCMGTCRSSCRSSHIVNVPGTAGALERADHVE